MDAAEDVLSIGGQFKEAVNVTGDGCDLGKRERAVRSRLLRCERIYLGSVRT